MMILTTPIKELKGIGPTKLAGLRRLGIETVDDLLHHYPSGYFFAPAKTNGPLVDGQPATIGGIVRNIRTWDRNFAVQLDTGVEIIWYGGGYLRSSIFRGVALIASGIVRNGGLSNPEWRVVREGDRVDESLLNVVTYPVTAGITSRDIARLVKECLIGLPAEYIIPASSVLIRVHRPRNQAEANEARRELKYDELLYMQLALALRQARREQKPPNVRCIVPPQNIGHYFPFRFTGNQLRATEEILGDLCSFHAMNRLLQGDVGCVDAATEFLSPTGWIPISEWAGQQVMQYDAQIRVASFTTPMRYIKAPCTEFIRLHTKYGVSQVLSPDHRCLVYRFSKATGKYDRADELTAAELEEEHNRDKFGFRGRFETAFTVERESSMPLTDAQLRVMVMACADGHIADNTSVVVSVKKLRKIVRAKQLLAEASIDYYETTSAGYTRLRFTPPVLQKGLEQFWAASPAQLRVIADEVLFWDGDQKSTFYTRRKPEADFVQYTFSACGYRSTICSCRRGDKTDYVVLRHKETKTGLMSNPKTAVTRVPSADGYKYCFTVPSSYLILRRDDRVFVTGNCGKTAVAAYAAIVMAFNGGQTVILCPTEILARQHYETVKGYFERAGVTCRLVTGAPVRESQASLPAAQIFVGTTALLGNRVSFPNLGLVIIDEQHKFGVEQRAALRCHGNPHVLVMTATPIPRTMAMTVFGDLDVSTIWAMPPGRIPVRTQWRASLSCGPIGHHAPSLDTPRDIIARELSAGHQVYVVCPRIEALDDEIRAVEEVWQEYCTLFPDASVAMLHGRMTPTEQQTVVEWWSGPSAYGRILVATTVVEVGVDNPNATVMVIEGAERFGLAQLHQLRGRVGCGSAQSYCFLLSSSDSQEARDRLKAMEQTNNGFEIAEADLRQRGPGDLLSTRQHGLPELHIADLVEDYDLLMGARKRAREIVAAGLLLASMQAELERRFGDKLLLGDCG